MILFSKFFENKDNSSSVKSKCKIFVGIIKKNFKILHPNKLKIRAYKVS